KASETLARLRAFESAAAAPRRLPGQRTPPAKSRLRRPPPRTVAHGSRSPSSLLSPVPAGVLVVDAIVAGSPDRVRKECGYPREETPKPRRSDEVREARPRKRPPNGINGHPGRKVGDGTTLRPAGAVARRP